MFIPKWSQGEMYLIACVSTCTPSSTCSAISHHIPHHHHLYHHPRNYQYLCLHVHHHHYLHNLHHLFLRLTPVPLTCPFQLPLPDLSFFLFVYLVGGRFGVSFLALYYFLSQDAPDSSCMFPAQFKDHPFFQGALFSFIGELCEKARYGH